MRGDTRDVAPRVVATVGDQQDASLFSALTRIDRAEQARGNVGFHPFRRLARRQILEGGRQQLVRELVKIHLVTRSHFLKKSRPSRLQGGGDGFQPRARSLVLCVHARARIHEHGEDRFLDGLRVGPHRHRPAEDDDDPGQDKRPECHEANPFRRPDIPAAVKVTDGRQEAEHNACADDLLDREWRLEQDGRGHGADSSSHEVSGRINDE